MERNPLDHDGQPQFCQRFIANTIPGRRTLTEQAIERGIGNREGEYQVWITITAKSSGFHIAIEGPKGRWVDRLFDDNDRDIRTDGFVAPVSHPLDRPNKSPSEKEHHQ